MSSAKEVLDRYNAMVPFPITPAKIKAAGYNPERYTWNLINDIECADDSNDPRVQKFLLAVDKYISNNSRL